MPPSPDHSAVGVGTEDGSPAHRLDIVGADDSPYLPQILQQQVQDLRGPLPLVVAKLLELTQLSLCGCQSGLEKQTQAQVTKEASECPTCSLQSSTAHARPNSLVIPLISGHENSEGQLMLGTQFPDRGT